jgi:tripartite-type tricarboxylate transporter receptor subunit TctC
MTLSRRRFLHLGAGFAALSGATPLARAGGYPTRPVRLVVGFTPGSTTDILARLIGQRLTARMGQSFIVENRPGAGSRVATEAVIHSPADGNTLLLVVPANAINATLYPNLNYDFLRDIAPVAGLIRVPFVMETSLSVPANTIPEFIEYAKSNPRKLNISSSGNGTGDHMAGELFKLMTGIDMVHLPYRGASNALTDLIAGQTQVMFATPVTSIEHIRGNRLRALGVTTQTRSEALPDIPAIGEFVPGYEASAFFGVGAPRGTPAEIVERLNGEINAALRERALRTMLADLSGMPIEGSAAEFGAFVADETTKWGRVIRSAGLKAD